MRSGRRLGSYEILDPLGAGGMGEVYLARDTTLGRQVALKVLPQELAGDPKLLSRLQREARTLATLDHPNIVSLYTIEEEDGVHFLTMAYVDGQSLEELIPRGGMEPDRVLELAEALAEALAAAHEQGIVHRDLKPANVMVEEDGRVRVLDFGIAKRVREVLETGITEAPTATMTELGTVIGTFPYMSPEQAEGREIDARSDLFSLGVLIYEMCVGVRPFQGETPTALVSSILKDTPPPLNHLKRGVPAGLARIVERCLEKDREDRYGSAGELLQELQAVRADGGKLSRVRKIAITAAIVALVAVGGWVAWRGTPGISPLVGPAASDSASISSLAVLPLRNGSGDPEQDYFADGMTEALITDLSKLSALRVTSRSAAMRYRDTDKSLEEIARELGVEAVVEGAVMREGDRVGVTVQLIEAETDRNLWAERYDRELTSVLGLQADVAQAIAEQIEVTLTPEEEQLLASGGTVDTEAYEAYLKGVYHWNELTSLDMDAALQYFQRALELDPDYAPAYAGIAQVWIGRQQMGVVSPAVAMPEARAAATRALELDDTLAEAHFTLAVLSAWGEWDWDAARRGFDRALEIQPNHARTLLYSAHVLGFLGELEEAMDRAERGLQLDPFDPLHISLYGAVQLQTGRLEPAVESFREALTTVPEHPVALEGLWESLTGLDRYDEAAEVAIRRLTVGGEEELVAALESGYAEAGYREGAVRAAEVLDRYPSDRFFPAALATQIYLDAGDLDGAFDWIAEAVEIRDPSLPYLTVTPAPEEFREDPRYGRLVDALGL